MYATAMLDLLTKKAKHYIKNPESAVINSYMNELSKDTKLDPKVVEAVVVDFINFIGRQNGIDYALYTKDLHEKDANQDSK
jgi:hypothetical protein